MASNDYRNKLMSLQGNLMNYAFMLTSDREMARRLLDCTTETALEQRPEAVDDASLKCWAFSIMRSIFTAEFSRKKTEHRVCADVYAVRLTTGAHVVTGVPLEGTYRSSDVTSALAELGDDYRRAAELYFAGYTMVEIASEMSLPMAVVKSRVAYCRSRLRVALSA